LDLPFLFGNGREADAIVDGPIGKQLRDKLTDKGLIGLGYWELGFRSLTNSRHPVAKLQDFKGLKIRVVQSPIYIDLFNTLGANAVPRPFPELYSALEQRAVDGQENPLKSIELSKFHEVQPHLSLTRHIYSPLSVLIGKKTWDKLSADEQKLIQDALTESQAYQRQFARAEDDKALAMLKTHMKVAELPPAEVAKARPVLSYRSIRTNGIRVANFIKPVSVEHRVSRDSRRGKPRFNGGAASPAQRLVNAWCFEPVYQLGPRPHEHPVLSPQAVQARSRNQLRQDLHKC
jgi:tripartite ATP-independent transporter DctP family solute receptor